MAFNAKNLEYNKQEPAFLRKLRGEFGGLDGRHNVQIARPKKDRLKTGDDDDDPVILDEQGELVEKEEFERRVKQGSDGNGQTGDGTAEAGSDAREEAGGERTSERQRVMEIGNATGPKKRKVGKVVGAEDEGDGDDGVDHDDSSTKQNTNKRAQPSEPGPAKRKETGASKKKGKKIKLSFDDADG